MREDPILQGILGFFGERVFGPKRKELLAADLKHVDGEPARDRARKMAALRRSLEDLELRAARQIRSLEIDDDARGLMFRKVRERLDEIDQERRGKEEELSRLEPEELENDPGGPELLDLLPSGRADFAPATEEIMRRIFDVFRLRVRYNKTSNKAFIRVSITADALDELIAASAHVVGALRRARSVGAKGDTKFAHVVGAPGAFARERENAAGSLCRRFAAGSVRCPRGELSKTPERWFLLKHTCSPGMTDASL